MQAVFFLLLLQLLFLGFVNGSVSILQGKQYVSLGEDRFLTCEFEGSDESEYEVVWKKSGLKVEITERIVLDGPELSISNIKASDAGSYTCDVHKNGDIMTSSPSDLVFYEKIAFKDCQNFASFAKGESEGTLSCNVSAVPAASLSWSHAGKTIKKSDTKFQAKKSQLTLTNLELSDSGLYYLVAKQQKEGIKNSFAINVTVHDPVVMVSEGRKVDVKEGQDTQLLCAAHGFPAPTFSFGDITQKDGFSVQVMGTEATLYVRAAKPQHGGNITCTAANEYTNAHSTFFLNVLEAPKVTRFENVTTKDTEKLEITCHVIANPAVFIEIGKVSSDDHTIKQKSMEATDTFTFVLDSSNLTSEGEYYCLAIHSDETDFEDHKITNYVEILYSPIVAVNQNTKVVKTWLDNPVQLVCAVRANPAPIIKWIVENDEGNKEELFFQETDGIPDDEISSFAGYHSKQQDNYYHSYIRVIPRNKDKIAKKLVCEASNELGTIKESFHVQEAFVPQAPEVTDITDLTATSFGVMVKGGNDGGAPITIYHVLHYENENRLEMKFNASDKEKTLLKIGELRQKTTYMVEVSSQNGVGLSKPTIFNVTTKDRAIPSKVIVKIEPSPCHDREQMVLNWEEPYSSGLPVTMYRVLYKIKPSANLKSIHPVKSSDQSDMSVMKEKKTSIRLKGLKQSAEYEVFVEAQNDVGWSKERDVQTFHTCRDEVLKIVYMGSAMGSQTSKGAAVTVPGLFFSLASLTTTLLFLF